MFKTVINAAVEEIARAFAGVVLGDGVSLHQAELRDDYADEEQQLAARQRDEHSDWRRISDDDLAACTAALSFMDPAGLRFHLPAYMTFALQRYRESESFSIDSTIYRLCAPQCIAELSAVLTPSQTRAVRTFLTTCLELAIADVNDVPLALRAWQGEVVALEQLRSKQLAMREATQRLTQDVLIPSQALFEQASMGDAYAGRT